MSSRTTCCKWSRCSPWSLLSAATLMRSATKRNGSSERCVHLAPADVVRGQFRGYRDEDGVARDSQVETFAAVRLHIDTWRWAGVPFYIRAGKRLPVTATEVLVELKRPPQAVFDLTPLTNRITSASGSARMSSSRSGREPKCPEKR